MTIDALLSPDSSCPAAWCIDRDNVQRGFQAEYDRTQNTEAARQCVIEISILLISWLGGENGLSIQANQHVLAP